MMIETYIAELLYKFDTVILPGFGAFTKINTRNYTRRRK